MKSLKAHVHNGQIVLDEPTQLPEGASVEVLLPDVDEPSTLERAALDDAIDDGAAQFARGEFEDAHTFARRLAGKS